VISEMTESECLEVLAVGRLAGSGAPATASRKSCRSTTPTTRPRTVPRTCMDSRRSATRRNGCGPNRGCASSGTSFDRWASVVRVRPVRGAAGDRVSGRGPAAQAGRGPGGSARGGVRRVAAGHRITLRTGHLVAARRCGVRGPQPPRGIPDPGLPHPGRATDGPPGDTRRARAADGLLGLRGDTRPRQTRVSWEGFSCGSG
jgi:hypothetical protein